MRIALYYADRDEALDAIRGGDWRAVCESLDQYLRSRLKHEDLPELVAEALRAVRERLREEIAGAGMRLWE